MAIAVALGGGAALGWAHIGVLRGLNEAKIPVKAVAGTSIGALASWDVVGKTGLPGSTAGRSRNLN